MSEATPQPPPASPQPARKDLLRPGLAAHLEHLTGPEPAPVAALREATEALPQGYYAMPRPETALLVLLLRATGARRFLEIGTFTGLTALAAALAMPDDGLVVTLDVDPAFPAVGQPFWQKAGVEGRIRLIMGPATASLSGIAQAGGRDSFDAVLIDADKENYPAYYDSAVSLVRPGGLVLLDNMLWRGRVLDPEDQGSKPRMFRKLAETIRDDPRVDACLLPLGDGLTVACRRP